MRTERGISVPSVCSAKWVRTGVDSVMETRLRMLIVLAGLPEPTINHILRANDGSWLRRIDLSYLDLRLAIEYDGRQHALDTKQWNSDIRRREELEQQGWRFIVVTADSLYGDPLGTLERIRTAVSKRGATITRRQPSPEWSRCFPGRFAA